MKQFSSCGMQLEAHSLMSCLGSVLNIVSHCGIYSCIWQWEFKHLRSEIDHLTRNWGLLTLSVHYEPLNNNWALKMWARCWSAKRLCTVTFRIRIQLKCVWKLSSWWDIDVIVVWLITIDEQFLSLAYLISSHCYCCLSSRRNSFTKLSRLRWIPYIVNVDLTTNYIAFLNLTIGLVYCSKCTLNWRFLVSDDVNFAWFHTFIPKWPWNPSAAK